MARMSAFTKPRTSEVFIAEVELCKFVLLSLKLKEMKYDIIADHDYTTVLVTSMRDKGDTKPSDIQQIKLSNLCRISQLT